MVSACVSRLHSSLPTLPGPTTRTTKPIPMFWLVILNPCFSDCFYENIVITTTMIFFWKKLMIFYRSVTWSSCKPFCTPSPTSLSSWTLRTTLTQRHSPSHWLVVRKPHFTLSYCFYIVIRLHITVFSDHDNPNFPGLSHRCSHAVPSQKQLFRTVILSPFCQLVSQNVLALRVVPAISKFCFLVLLMPMNRTMYLSEK